jgi:glycosyltransferase involved in cell wall biosynthesis
MAVISKNVLLLFSSSDIGGAERSLSRMVFENSDKFLSYQIATFGLPGSLSKWIETKSLKCLCFDYKILLLLKYIHFNKPDIIYVIGFRLSILLRIYCKIFTKSLIIQGVRWNPSSNSKLDIAFRFFERFFSFMLDGYIVNCKSAESQINSISKKQVKVIYNGICDFNGDVQVQSKKNWVITVANLTHRKGHKQYLGVIKNIVKDSPETNFLFLGYDNLNGKIQKIIIKENLSSNVKYLGFQENIKPFLKESSIFVLPSLYGEGCPTSVLEAFCYKLPVIAYKVDGIPELVTNNVDGMLINLGDEAALEIAIKDLLINPDKALEMGEKGYHKVLNNFSMESMLEKHNTFFLSLN